MGTSCSLPPSPRDPPESSQGGQLERRRSSPDGAPQSSDGNQQSIESVSDKPRSSPPQCVTLPVTTSTKNNENQSSSSSAVPTDSPPSVFVHAPSSVRISNPGTGTPPPAVAALPEVTKSLLSGITPTRPEKSTEINIYHIAHLHDSHVERDYLTEKVYPKLRVLCAEQGYELNLVDLHWGLNDSASYNQTLTKTTLKTLKQLKESDSGFIVLAFLNDKYGCQCPKDITEADFDKARMQAPEEEQVLLNKWYQLVDFREPPVYKLVPIQKHLPRYSPGKLTEYRNVMKEYSMTQDQLKDILQKTGLPEEYFKSDIAMELEEVLNGKEERLDGFICIDRTFKDVPDIQEYSETLSNYYDITHDEIDEIAKKELKILKNKLKNKMVHDCFIEETVTWKDGGVTRGSKEHLKYLSQIGDKVRKTLSGFIQKFIDCRNEQKLKLAHPGISKSLYTELAQQSNLCIAKPKYCGPDEPINDILNYLTHGNVPEIKTETVHPLVVHGPMGWGRTRLAATLAQLAMTWDGGSPVMIYRRAGVTAGSLTLEHILTSVAEQICIVSGIHPMYAYKDLMSVGAFERLLLAVPENISIAIILDQIDELLQPQANLTWLPKNLPSNARVVITIATETFNTIKEDLWLKSHSYILKGWTKQQITEALISINNTELTCSPKTFKRVQQYTQECHTVMALRLMIHIYENNSPSQAQPESPNGTLNDVLELFFDMLDSVCGFETVGRCLGYLCKSRYGISYSEMLDLLSCDETVLQAHYTQEAPNVRRTPSIVWINLKQYVEPLLSHVQVGGIVYYRIIQQNVIKTATKRYSKYFVKISNSLMDYFEERWANGKKLTFAESKEGIDISKERYVKAQPVRYGRVVNRRKLDELCYQQGLLKKYAPSLFDFEHITAKLETSGVHSLIYDVTQQSAISSDNDDLQFFALFLKTNKYHLQQNGKIFSDIFCKSMQSNQNLLNKTKSNLKSLYEAARKCVVPSLSFVKNISLPKREYPTLISHKVSKVFRLKTEKNYVVSIDTDNGKVTVWNIYTQEATRTLTGVDRPRNVKMISNTKAVILCNRELKIYDLEKGRYITKLKGVLNLKMPFYEIVDDHHVIILSRNRMYLNIVNIESCDTEATFKAGEDRFMNSLLVSDNGEKCVCGDEVQKPFPLLVWDLPNRKLIHDMRLAGHDFLTNMSQITYNGNYVVSVCKEVEDPVPNCIVVYDLDSGALFKKWKASFNATCVAISAHSSLVISGHENGDVIVWDLIGGNKKFELEGHCNGPSHLCLSDDGTRCASWDSTGWDTSVRLWDTTQGKCLGVYLADEPISCCEIAADGTRVIICVPSYDGLITLQLDGASAAPRRASEYGDTARLGMTFDMSIDE